MLKRERTCRVIALTRDLYLIASRVPTGFSAVFLSLCYVAQAGYVCALLALLIGHGMHPSQAPYRTPVVLRFWRRPLCSTKPSELEGRHSMESAFWRLRYLDQLHAALQTPPRHYLRYFKGFAASSKAGVSADG